MKHFIEQGIFIEITINSARRYPQKMKPCWDSVKNLSQKLFSPKAAKNKYERYMTRRRHVGSEILL